MPLNYSSHAAGLRDEVDPSSAEDEPWMRDLDAVVSSSHTVARFVMRMPDELDYEIIEDEVRLTAYDRWREELRQAEEECAACEPDTPEHADATGKVAVARRRLQTEIERDGDDEYRKRRRIDEHRAGEGREEYNTSRRKVRPEPNVRLTDITAEERATHENRLNADRVWKSKKRKAGWTDEQIAVGLATRKAKRAKKI